MAATSTPTQRGSVSLHKSLFDLEPVNVTTVEVSMTDKRNECLVDFYYYTGQKQIEYKGRFIKMAYSDLLEIVSNTFFISSITVHNVLQSNRDKLALVKQQWKDKSEDEMKKHFQTKWPQFVW